MLVQQFSSRILTETDILFQVPVYYLNADFDYWNMLDWNRGQEGTRGSRGAPGGPGGAREVKTTPGAKMSDKIAK